MIRYALICADCETEFEAWFASSSAYDALAAKNQLDCPSCPGHHISKQIMAPAVRSSKQSSTDKDKRDRNLLQAAKEHIAATHEYTGSDFPDEARAMHYGEVEERPIWGESTPEEAKALHEEGVAAMPLPAALTPVPPKDKKKLN